MTVQRTPVNPPTQASLPRRVLHTAIALAGWVLFVYWWWLVFHRVSRHEMRFTALFIAISLVVIVVVTAGWAFHNIRIFRRRGPRKAVREVQADYAHDGVGRAVTFTGVADRYRLAPVVHVRVEGEDKVYEAATILAHPSAPPTAPAQPPAPGPPGA